MSHPNQRLSRHQQLRILFTDTASAPIGFLPERMCFLLRSEPDIRGPVPSTQDSHQWLLARRAQSVWLARSALQSALERKAARKGWPALLRAAQSMGNPCGRGRTTSHSH